MDDKSLPTPTRSIFSIAGTNRTTCGTPVLRKEYRIFFPRSMSVLSTSSPQGAVIWSLTRRPDTSARMSPARVSNDIDLPPQPRSDAYRAAQRPPFPHISAADPSALKKFHRKSALRERARKIIPSAPIDRDRSHTLAANRERSCPFITPFRLSTRGKSLPPPFSFGKALRVVH